MYRFPWKLILIACACAALSAAGQSPKPSARMEELRLEYQKATNKAQAACDVSVKLAGDDYKRQLTQLMDAETKAGKLDAALVVREEIKAVEDAAPKTKVATKAALKKTLENTRWSWADEALTLKADGTANHPAWIAGKLVTSWEAVDRRTVVVSIVKGRDTNRIAVLEFSEALDEFKGYDFSGSRLESKKRLPALSK